MQAIHKFMLPAHSGRFTLWMPQGAQLIHVNVQHGLPCLWALVQVANKGGSREFEMRLTGAESEPVGPYVGTVLLDSGAFVLHMFEVRQP